MAADILEQAISLAKSGENEGARRLFESVIQQDPENERAWKWLANIVETDYEKRICFEKILSINPDSIMAKIGMARLAEAESLRAAQTSPVESPQPAAPAPPTLEPAAQPIRQSVVALGVREPEVQKRLPDRGTYFFGRKVSPLLVIGVSLACICLCLAFAISSLSTQNASTAGANREVTATQAAVANKNVVMNDHIASPTPLGVATLAPTAMEVPTDTPSAPNTPPPTNTRLPTAISAPVSAEVLTNDDWGPVLSNPNNYVNQPVRLTGKIFNNPETNGDIVAFQMYTTRGGTDGNTVVVGPAGLKVNQDDYVRVEGKVLDTFEGQNVLGQTLRVPRVQATDVTIISPQEAVAPTIKRLGTTVLWAETEFTVTKVEKAKTLTTSEFGNTLDAKGIWLIVYMTLKNNGKDNTGIGGAGIELYDSADVKYDMSTEWSVWDFIEYRKLYHLGDQLPPGMPVHTALVYDIDPGARGFKLLFMYAGTGVDLGQ